MKANKIKTLIINKGVDEASEYLEEELIERSTIKYSFVLFLCLFMFLFGLIIMYFMKK